MKLVDTCYLFNPQSPTRKSIEEEIEMPCLEDLHKIIMYNPDVRYLYTLGLKRKLSTEQTFILIVQGLVKQIEKMKGEKQ